MRTLRANGCESLQKLPDLSSLSSYQLEVDLPSCCELSRKGVKVADVSLLEGLPKMGSVEILLIGGEMPEWFLPCENGFLYFVVPQDLSDKFRGLVLCVVLGVEKGKVANDSCEIQISVNGQSVIWQRKHFYSSESDHLRLLYFPRSMLNVTSKCRNQFEICLSTSEGTFKKCGFRPICEQQEDDLRVVL
ncbi:uncharacterized protein LOC115732907 [Rhodamnia argentea]|uniref:Uncharacterized protein LOC115732907 n=1 Tax=Rhodamnia argentea TaxID=178133 RepID=A0A8B8NAI7_9MYRT|nr:uncharacterized protein LOC115732907 [Rhodamnia argentea]